MVRYKLTDTCGIVYHAECPGQMSEDDFREWMMDGILGEVAELIVTYPGGEYPEGEVDETQWAHHAVAPLFNWA